MVAKRAPMQHEEKVATRDRQCCINNIKIKIIEELLFDKRFPVMLEKLSSISCTNATYKCWPRKKNFLLLQILSPSIFFDTLDYVDNLSDSFKG